MTLTEEFLLPLIKFNNDNIRLEYQTMFHHKQFSRNFKYISSIWIYIDEMKNAGNFSRLTIHL